MSNTLQYTRVQNSGTLQNIRVLVKHSVSLNLMLILSTYRPLFSW